MRNSHYLLFMLSFCMMPLMVACRDQLESGRQNKAAATPPSSTAEQKVQDTTPDLKQVSGAVKAVIKNPDVKMLFSKPGVFSYVVQAKNDTGISLENSSAHLYLLSHDFSMHEIHANSLTVLPDGMIGMIFRFESSSPIHKKLADWVSEIGIENHHMLTVLTPDIEIYIKSSSGVIEIDTTRVKCVFPIPSEGEPMVQSVEKNRPAAGRQVFADYFAAAGIDRPTNPDATVATNADVTRKTQTDETVSTDRELNETGPPPDLPSDKIIARAILSPDGPGESEEYTIYVVIDRTDPSNLIKYEYAKGVFLAPDWSNISVKSYSQKLFFGEDGKIFFGEDVENYYQHSFETRGLSKLRQKEETIIFLLTLMNKGAVAYVPLFAELPTSGYGNPIELLPLTLEDKQKLFRKHLTAFSAMSDIGSLKEMFGDADGEIDVHYVTAKTWQIYLPIPNETEEKRLSPAELKSVRLQYVVTSWAYVLDYRDKNGKNQTRTAIRELDPEYRTELGRILSDGSIASPLKPKVKNSPIRNCRIDSHEAFVIAEKNGGHILRGDALNSSGRCFLRMADVDGELVPVWFLPHKQVRAGLMTVRADTGEVVNLTKKQ